MAQNPLAQDFLEIRREQPAEQRDPRALVMAILADVGSGDIGSSLPTGFAVGTKTISANWGSRALLVNRC